MKLRDLNFVFNPNWVVAEDGNLLVINKPSGLLTHATADKSRVNLVDLLRAARPNLPKLTLQHRLDKDTSGLILFTVGDLLRARVAQKFASGEMEKQYLCWVKGSRLASKWLVDAPLASKSGRVFVGEGQEARTEFELLKRQGAYCLLKARPLTGRKHQIRAHLSHCKLPIVGDTIFKGEPHSRLLLHAYSLRFSLEADKIFEWSAAAAQDFTP